MHIMLGILSETKPEKIIKKIFSVQIPIPTKKLLFIAVVRAFIQWPSTMLQQELWEGVLFMLGINTYKHVD